MTRAVVGLESVFQHSVMYCNREGWQQGAMYCNTLHCIVAGRAAGGKVVSQYNLEYCGRKQDCLCRKAGSCVVTRRCAEALGARLGARGTQAGCWGAQAAGGRWAGAQQGRAEGKWNGLAAGRKNGRATGRRAGRWGIGAAGRRARAAGRADWAAWARPGRVAGQRAVHFVHSSCFWPGLTQYCS